jgi:predicted nucleotidyltransferase
MHRELQQFLSAGLVREKRVGGRRFYLPNEAHPVHEELRSLARKLLGIPAMIQRELEPFKDTIETAFIYGSIAKGVDDAESDIDVMIVGRCDLVKLLDAMQTLEPALRRPISVRFYDPGEYRKLLRSDPFLARVAAGPRISLLEGHARDGVAGPQPRRRRP